MKKKKFDCVDMMHDFQAKIMKRLEGMSEQEQLAYWNKKSDEIVARRQAKKHPKTAAGKRG